MIDEENQVEEMQSSGVDSGSTNVSPNSAEQANENAPEQPVSLADLDISGIDIDEVVADAPSLRTKGSGANDADYQAKVANLEAEIASLKAQLDDRTSQYMRIAADFDNFRKRTQREKEEFEQQIKCSTINELLPVVDNFERARSQLKPQTEQETNIHKSYQSVYRQLVDGLKQIGVSPMRAEGKEFDPKLHEAVNTQPTDEHPEGTVIEEYQRGYMLGERVLRHALVKVAAALDPVVASEENSQGNPDD